MAGSALLEDEALVGRILEAVVSAVEVPVTLKIRTGPDPERRNGVRIARLAQACGVAALAVHGRTRSDRFLGQAEYATIRDICLAVDIPVFANGDIDSPRQAVQVLQATGAAGLMFGRGAQGNPWMFREIDHYLRTGREMPPPSPAEVHAVMREHLRALHDFYGEPQGVRVARKHIGWYLEGRPGGASLRKRLMPVESAAGQLRLLDEHFGPELERVA
jgi:tRNA-dihydrouridine synthase B